MNSNAAIALFSLAALLAPQEAVAPANTAEDVDVLEKLLVDELNALQPPGGVAAYRRPDVEGEADGRRNPSLYDGLVSMSLEVNGTVRHSRGFHLPGAGLFFAIDLDLPATAAASEDQESAPPAKEDEWERARRALRGEASAESSSKDSAREPAMLDFDRAVQAVRGARWVVDDAALERARDVVFDVLARHGRRVRGLAPEESITVALHVTSTPRGAWPLSVSMSTLTARDLGLPQTYWQRANTPDPNKAESWSRWLTAYGMRSTPPVRLVIQVRASDLASAASAAEPAAHLRESAHMYRY